MKNYFAVIIAAALMISVLIIRQRAHAQNVSSQSTNESSVTSAETVAANANTSAAPGSGEANQESPLCWMVMPTLARDFKL